MSSHSWKVSFCTLIATATLALLAPSAFAECAGGIRNNAFGDLQAVIIPTADIAGNDGWKPLSQFVSDYGIDSSFTEEVMDGGGELTCKRKNAEGQTTISYMNGWFAEGEAALITNGHFMYEDTDHGKIKRTDFSNCYLATNRDVLNSPDSSKYPKQMVDSNTAHYELGGLDPAGLDSFQDRARLPLANGRPKGSKAKAIKDFPELAKDLLPKTDTFPGSEVIVVSSARAFHSNTTKGGFEPMAQVCHVLRIESSGKIVTDCDSHHGVSGARMYVRDPLNTSKLKSIGILTRGREHPTGAIDGRPADADENSAVALVTDASYYNYPVKGDTVVAVANTPASDNSTTASGDSN